ncbi:MAG: alcohol dehydrogenase catalytic domain-containing protein [Chloroflexota bacterium]
MTLPATFKKVVIRQTGRNPHTCLAVIDDAPLKTPSAHDVLIRNHYAGVNSMDIGRMLGVDGWQQALPMDFGIETIGEVVAIGKEVTNLAVGDVVMTALPGNGFREYTHVAHNLTMKMPAIAPRYVSTLISGSLGKIAIEFLGEVRADDVVVITSGLGSSGNFALQLAINAGSHVITTCNNAEEAKILQQWQPNRIINRVEEDIATVLAEEYPDAVTLVFDKMGGRILDACIKQTAPRARVILADALTEHLRGEDITHRLDFYHQVIRNSLTITGINLSDYANAIKVETLKLLDLMEQGLVEALIDKRSFVGIEQVPDAIAYLMSGEARGKVVVKFVE